MYTLTRPITNCCAALTGLLCYAAMQQVQYSVYKVLLAQLAAVCANCKPKSTEDEKQDKFYQMREISQKCLNPNGSVWC